MTREDEIRILIEYLEKDVIETSNRYRSLLSKTIIQNGKLIEKYNTELEEILKNEINLNVIIDKDSDSGLVYKNDI